MVTSELETRVRDLEIGSAARASELTALQADVRQLACDQRDCREDLRALERSLLKLMVPMKAATWAAAVFAASVIALIWSLILGKAQLIFP